MKYKKFKNANAVLRFADAQGANMARWLRRHEQGLSISPYSLNLKLNELGFEYGYLFSFNEEQVFVSAGLKSNARAGEWLKAIRAGMDVGNLNIVHAVRAVQKYNIQK